MPLTEKGSSILENMKEQYGEEKGERVFYASKNKGTISGVDQGGSIGKKSPAMYAAMREQEKKEAEENKKIMEASKTSPRYLAAREALGLSDQALSRIKPGVSMGQIRRMGTPRGR